MNHHLHYHAAWAIYHQSVDDAGLAVILLHVLFESNDVALVLEADKKKRVMRVGMSVGGECKWTLQAL